MEENADPNQNAAEEPPHLEHDALEMCLKELNRYDKVAKLWLVMCRVPPPPPFRALVYCASPARNTQQC